MQSINRVFQMVSDIIENHKIIARLCALVFLVFALVLCWTAGKNHEGRKPYAEIPESNEEFETNFPYLALTELDKQSELSDVETINLSEYNGICEITKGGNFRLTGEINGTVCISAKEQNVHLFLDNATIKSAVGPALYCKEADKLVITLPKNTENIVSDSGKYQADEEIEGCIYSTCDMTLNGNGKLTVNGLYKDAIRSKDLVKILDGEYEIKCKRTGIHGNDGIYICGGDFTILSEKNGLKTTKTGAEGRGDLVIGGGEFTIIAGQYAFVTVQADLCVYDCRISDSCIVDVYKVAGLVNIQKGCLEND